MSNIPLSGMAGGAFYTPVFLGSSLLKITKEQYGIWACVPALR